MGGGQLCPLSDRQTSPKLDDELLELYFIWIHNGDICNDYLPNL